MSTNDLIADFYKSHPAAIRLCIKAEETSYKNPSSASPSSCLSAKEHLLQFKLASPLAVNSVHVPLSPTIMNSSTSSQNITLLENEWPSLVPCSPEPLIPASHLEDSPPPRYSPLEPTTVSRLSGCTPKEITCISSLLSLIETPSKSTSTGQPGSQGQMKTQQTSTTKLSKYPQKASPSSEPESSINAVNHQDTHPYLHKNKIIIPPKPAQTLVSRPSTPTTKQPKDQKKTVNQDQTTHTKASLEATTNQLFSKLRKKLADKCAKAFVAMHKKWETYSKQFEEITVAKLFRWHDEDMALYLLRIQPRLYVEATMILKGKGIDMPNPTKSKWTAISGKCENLMVLRAHLAKPRNRVEAIPLEGTSCYDLPLKFSLPSSSSATSPPFAVPQSNPKPSPTLIFPSALLNLSPPQPAQPPIQPPDQPLNMSSHQSYLLPKYHSSLPKPLPYQEAHLPFPAVEPQPPTPPIPWSQHTRQYSSMEYLADQKLEHTPEEDSPMSDDFPESSIVIPADWPNYQSIPVPDHVPAPQLLDFNIPIDWPSQYSIPEPDHMQETQPISHDIHPAVPSHRPPLEVTIPEDPLSPASSLGKHSASPNSIVSQPQYAHIWNAEGLIHKHLPTYDGAHTIAVLHHRSPPESASASPEASPDAPSSTSEPTINASILNPTLTSPIGYLSP